jgi:hypothetical protein
MPFYGPPKVFEHLVAVHSAACRVVVDRVMDLAKLAADVFVPLNKDRAHSEVGTP